MLNRRMWRLPVVPPGRLPLVHADSLAAGVVSGLRTRGPSYRRKVAAHAESKFGARPAGRYSISEDIRSIQFLEQCLQSNPITFGSPVRAREPRGVLRQLV